MTAPVPEDRDHKLPQGSGRGWWGVYLRTVMT